MYTIHVDYVYGFERPAFYRENVGIGLTNLNPTDTVRNVKTATHQGE